MSRKQARESVYKLVFEYMFSKQPNKKTYEVFSAAESAETDRAYMLGTYKGVMSHYDELVSTIESFAENFTIDRIFKADMAALLVAAYEMYYCKDIPQSVSIAEAVELVKKYSTEKSYQYVNGILSKIYKTLNP